MGASLCRNSTILLIVACATSCALRQGRSPFVDEWSAVAALPPGASIELELVESKRLAGNVVGVESDALLLTPGNFTGRIARSEIIRIWRVLPSDHDSLLNGVLLGFGVGAGLGLASMAIYAESEGGLSAWDWTRGVLVTGAIGAAIGAVAGAVADARRESVRRVEIYRR